MSITIINYGLGNLRSVQKALERLGIRTKISSDLNEISSAEKLLLPGVGHFKKGMKNIITLGLLGILNEKVLKEKVPILGICLGMQLMTKFSEEGNVEGFGWIDAETKKFILGKKHKIPHMGWNNIDIIKKNGFTKNISEKDFFYFVHSFYVTSVKEEDLLFKTEYGQEFVSGFNKDNIYGVQFHPEKSHDAGLQLLKNFSEL
jgi:glutamine amidotransferase